MGVPLNTQSPWPWHATMLCGVMFATRRHFIMAQEYTLFIDARERHLAALFGAGAVEVVTLDVGDVLCEYPDGTSWVAERKTAADC